jgi:hypothetical protein
MENDWSDDIEKVLENIVQFYIEQEEYEKCNVLLNILNNNKNI